MACEVCEKVYVLTEDILLDSDMKPHLCNTCGKSFSLKIQLKRHMMTHANGAPYTCYSCEKNSNNHSKTYNLRLTKKGNYVCEKCNTSFSTGRLLLKHSKEHDVPESFTCEECYESFDTELALKKHSSTHRVKRPYRRHSAKVDVDESSFVCGECGKKFFDMKSFEKHSMVHKKHVCSACSKNFVTATALEKHHRISKCKTSVVKKVEKRENVIEENDSGSKYSTFSVKTLEKKENVPGENYSASECKTFNTKKTMQKSENMVEENDPTSADKKHICDICGKSFSRKSSLEGHVIIHMTEENDSEIDDDFYDHDYVQKSDEKEEQDLEPPRLPKLKIRTKFYCVTCKEIFTSDEALRKHELIHKDSEIKGEPELVIKLKKEVKEKKYKCSICNESFISKKKLDSHNSNVHGIEKQKKKSSYIYTDQNTYMCEICDKIIVRKSRMKKHLLFHENKIDEDVSSDDMDSIRKRKSREKNFACEICGKRFAGKVCLDKHVLRHSDTKEEASSNGEAPISKRRKVVKELICEFCKEDFTGRKNSYIKHRNLHTPEVCGICDERFVDRQALREHCKVHIGTEEARVFLECSQKAFNAKNGVVPPEPKVEYIYLVLR